MDLSTHKPQKPDSVYKSVQHVPYPPMDNAFEVSPAPPADGQPAQVHGGQSSRVPYDTIATDGNYVNYLSYERPVVPKSYAPFVSTMEPAEPSLPGYERSPLSSAGQEKTATGVPVPVINVPPPATAAPTMSASTKSPGTTAARTNTNSTSQNWRNTQFDCFSYQSTCLGSTFCVPCLFGRTSSLIRQQKLAAQSQGGGGTDLRGNDFRMNEYVGPSCMLFSLCAVVTGGLGACGYTYMRRSEVRERYAIGGDDLDDLCVSCCCVCCAVGQMDLEVRSRLLNS